MIRKPKLAVRGFALVVTLTLMILLTVVAIGLLSLSSITLRSSQSGAGLAIAQANARTALILAIGELQRFSGDDRRVTVTADQLPASGGGDTAAAQGQRYWTGVYRAWDSDPTNEADQWSPRPDPESRFLSWLVSPPGLVTPSAATTRIAGERIRIVGPGSAGGSADRWVEVGKIPCNQGGATRGNMAWWVADQGVKSSMYLVKPEPAGLASDVRHSMQAAAAANFETIGVGATKPFAVANFTDARLSAMTSIGQSEHLIDSVNRAAARELFHAIAPNNSGMLTNVRLGGFRKDLSMYLQLSDTSAQRDVLARDVLYSVPSQNGVSREIGINMEELAAYYKLHNQLVPGTGTYTTDGAPVPSSASMLRFANSPDNCRADYFHLFKQPVPIAYDTFISLDAVAQPPVAGGAVKYRLQVVIDPVLIMWNPLDVPVSIPSSSVPSVKYMTPPLTLRVDVTSGGGTVTRLCHLQGNLATGGDHNYMSLDLTVAGQPLVFRPGEVMMISQARRQTGGFGDRYRIEGRPGFNFSSGLVYPLKYGESQTSQQNVVVDGGDRVEVTVLPSGFTIGQPAQFPGNAAHSRSYGVAHHEFYVGRDRTDLGQSLPVGGISIDWDFAKIRLSRTGALRGYSTPGNKRAGGLRANTLEDFMPPFEPIVITDPRELVGVKKSVALMSFRLKTEFGVGDNSRGTSWLNRFNPRVFRHDFYDFSARERDYAPYEFHVLRLAELRGFGLLEQTAGRAYFGPAWTQGDGGQPEVITHSVPREPVISLGALQHSMANGFLFQQPRETPGPGFGPINSRDPLNPQISHAIGNSLAPAVMNPDQTHAIMPDGSGRSFADHSYLANRALWDEYFLSSIAPMPATGTSLAGATQKSLAQGFLEGSRQLPNRRYIADLGSLTTTEALGKLFSGNDPRPEARDFVASLIRVQGMFNINSTSVEAWRSLLSAHRSSSIVTQNANGGPEVSRAGDGKVPVPGLLTPRDEVVTGSTFQDAAPWVGRRELTDGEIDALARSLVREIRLSGPFLSLADFVNRRPGSDKKLAVAGVIERALRDASVAVNDPMKNTNAEVDSATAGRFAFPAAELGLKSHGVPGIVKQADILTPLAPFISARSDNFVIRACGEALDAGGKVIATAWCEATVERGRDFVDPKDVAETPIASLASNTNKQFGRRFQILHFRWLQPDEV